MAESLHVDRDSTEVFRLLLKRYAAWQRTT